MRCIEIDCMIIESWLYLSHALIKRNDGITRVHAECGFGEKLVKYIPQTGIIVVTHFLIRFDAYTRIQIHIYIYMYIPTIEQLKAIIIILFVYSTIV